MCDICIAQKYYSNTQLFFRSFPFETIRVKQYLAISDKIVILPSSPFAKQHLLFQLPFSQADCLVVSTSRYLYLLYLHTLQINAINGRKKTNFHSAVVCEEWGRREKGKELTFWRMHLTKNNSEYKIAFKHSKASSILSKLRLAISIIKIECTCECIWRTIRNFSISSKCLWWWRWRSTWMRWRCF